MALSKNQLEYISDDLVSLYQELEKWSINDICRRVAKTNTWTETSELMVEALREQGYSPIEIQQRVLSRLQASQEYKEELAINTYEHKAELKQKVAELNADRHDLVKAAMEEVHATGMRYDMSMWEQAGKTLTEASAINQVTKAMIKNADKDLKNLTKSLGFKTSSGWTSEAEAYQKQLNLALMKVSSGTCSYQTAVDDVVKELSKSGLRTIDYERGISRQLDTSVRNSILTAGARLTGEISMQNALSSGEDLVEVSHHAGARTDGSGGPEDHAFWQGKVYSISGMNHAKESARLGYPIKSLEKVTGYPSDATGLMGYYCGHNFFIFFEGISEPAVKEPEPEPKSYMGKSYTLYEANQKQRQMERDIRATKRKISATKAVNGDNSMNFAKLISMEKEYKNFSEAMEIRAKTNRLKVAESVNGKRVKGVARSSEALESDVGDKMKSLFNGVSKQKKEFVIGLDNVTNESAKKLFIQSLNRVTVKRSASRRSEFSVKEKTIYLSKNTEVSTLAHELFHEIDNAYLLTKNGLLKESVRSDYKTLCNMSKGYGKSIEEMLYLKYKDAFETIEDVVILKQEYRAISDILNGMSGGKIKLGYIHPDRYWKKDGNLEAETFSQFGRSLYSNSKNVLSMMADLFPNSYREVTSTIERMIK